MKKHLSMMLVSSMILATLTGCGSTESTTGGTSGGTTTGGTNLDDRDMNLSGENAITFPLEEAVNYTFHYHKYGRNDFYLESGDVLPVYSEMENITNISFTSTGNPVATDSPNEIALQSVDKFPSDLYGGDSVGTYAMQYGPYGAFYSLDDYWEYLPNYSAFLQENPDVLASTVGADGKLYHIPFIMGGDVARTYNIRQDWLDNLGLEMPTTVQDLEDVLIAFRDDDPNGNGKNDEIPFFNDGWEEAVRLVNFWDARCYSNDDRTERIVLGDDGVWYYTWTSDEFKNGIENVSRWYDMGLIDAEIFTKGSASRKEYLPGDVGGMTYDWIASTSSYNDTVSIEGFNLVTMAPPVTESGNQWCEHMRAKVKPEGFAISTSCDEDKVPALFAYLDYFWSEEGRILSNYGVEGQHWDYVDGAPVFNSSVLENDALKAVNTYLMQDVGAQLLVGYWLDYDYERQWTNAIGQAGVDMYTQNGYLDGLFMLPELNYTEDELEERNSLKTSINTYANERIQEFIIGDWTQIDGKWDDYVAHANNLGIQDLLDLYSTAYDRFQSYM